MQRASPSTPTEQYLRAAEVGRQVFGLGVGVVDSGVYTAAALTVTAKKRLLPSKGTTTPVDPNTDGDGEQECANQLADIPAADQQCPPTPVSEDRDSSGRNALALFVGILAFSVISGQLKWAFVIGAWLTSWAADLVSGRDFQRQVRGPVGPIPPNQSPVRRGVGPRLARGASGLLDSPLTPWPTCLPPKHRHINDFP